MTGQTTPQHLFCFGLGYSAQVLARRLLANGWRLSGTCRSPHKAEALRRQGIKAHLFVKDQPLADTMGTVKLSHSTEILLENVVGHRNIQTICQGRVGLIVWFSVSKSIAVERWKSRKV